MAAFGQCGRRARRARSSPRPIAMPMTRQTVAVCGDELATAPSLNLSRSLRRVSRGGEVAFADLGAGVGDGCPNVGKIADRRGRAAPATNPPATSAAARGAADTLKSSVSRVIDLRTDIVMLLADATRTGVGAPHALALEPDVFSPATTDRSFRGLREQQPVC
jgi:hypothetical protein